MEKRECIFSAKDVAKNVQCKAAEKKEIEKARQKLGCQLLLSKEIILRHPCVPCARLTISDAVLLHRCMGALT